MILEVQTVLSENNELDNREKPQIVHFANLCL